MKKEVIIFSLIFLLSISFISANWFGDFFGNAYENSFGKVFGGKDVQMSPKILKTFCFKDNADINHDRVIDDIDVGLLKKQMNQKCTSPMWCDCSDINQDGVVNVLDYNILGQQMGHNGCVSNCVDKICGDDGCGGSCGTCKKDFNCVENKCVEQSLCGNSVCDAGENCNSCDDCLCEKDEICQLVLTKGLINDYSCIPKPTCVPQCKGKTCGDDGCGGNCGVCKEGYACTENKCVEEHGSLCGNGFCKGDENCNNCKLDCGCEINETCAGVVNIATGNKIYSCIPKLTCISKCLTRECGDDGCGGSCGVCGAGESCGDGECVEEISGDCQYGFCLSEIIIEGERKTGEPLNFLGSVTNIQGNEKEIGIGLTDDGAFVKERNILLGAYETKDFEITYWPFFSGERRFAIEAMLKENWDEKIRKEYLVDISGDDLPTDKCADGTEWFTCSEQQPLYCVKNMYWDQYPNLYNYCFECGCPRGEICQEDGSCKIPQESKNRAPYADAGLDKVVYKGERFKLNAFDSWDKDYWQTLSYSWGDSKRERIPNGVTPTATLDKEGVHEIKLTVSDINLTDKDDVTIGVAEDSPWWDEGWKQRVPIVLENKNNEKKNLPVFIRLYKIFGREFDFSAINTNSIRVITNSPMADVNGINYLIFDVDGIEGVSVYDLLIFKTSFAKNEAKTFYIYYDNPNSQKLEYLDYYNGVILNENNILDNPSFEEGVDENNKPLQWTSWPQGNCLLKQYITTDENHTGKYSAKIDYPYQGFGERECDFLGWYQNHDLSISTKYAMGCFGKVTPTGSLGEDFIEFFGIIFQQADASFIQSYFGGDEPGIGQGQGNDIFYRAKKYNDIFGPTHLATNTDWMLYFEEFKSPIDNAESHLTVFTGNYGKRWQDDFFLIEQPEFAIGEKESIKPTINLEDYSLSVIKLQRIFLESEFSPSDSIEIESAKNEEEFFHIAIQPNINLENVEIESGSLINKDAGGKISNIKIMEEKFLPLKLPSQPIYGLGKWADPLVTYKTRNMAAEKSHPIWVQISVPKDTLPGIYLGKIKIKPSNSEGKEIIIRLNVRDFELPNKPHYRSNMGVLPEFEQSLYKKDWAWMEPESKYYYHEIFNYLNVSSQHRISSNQGIVSIGACYDPNSKNIKINFTKNNMEQQFNYMFNNKKMDGYNLIEDFGHFFNLSDFVINGCNEEGLLFLEPLTEDYNIAVSQYLDIITSYMDENGWNKLGEIQPWSETVPVYDENPYIYSDGIKSLHEVIGEDIWNKIYFIGEHLPGDESTAEIDGYFDTYRYVKSNFQQIEGEKLQELQDEGYNFSLFWADQVVDQHIMNYRDVGWLMWEYELVGFRHDFWAANLGNYERTSVWENPMATYYFRLNGDMYFTYQGAEMDYNAPTEDKGPITSIRFELMRESLEDYEYFWMLNDLIEKAKQRGIDTQNAETTLDRVSEMINHKAFELNHDPELLYEIRSQVADEIENLLNQMPEEKAKYSPEQKNFFSRTWSRITGKVVDMFF